MSIQRMTLPDDVGNVLLFGNITLTIKKEVRIVVKPMALEAVIFSTLLRKWPQEKLKHEKKEGGGIMVENKRLNKAQDAREDEFFIQLTNIEKEMWYYRRNFSGKTILCNCDDLFLSNFFLFCIEL